MKLGCVRSLGRSGDGDKLNDSRANENGRRLSPSHEGQGRATHSVRTAFRFRDRGAHGVTRPSISAVFELWTLLQLLLSRQPGCRGFTERRRCQMNRTNSTRARTASKHIISSQGNGFLTDTISSGHWGRAAWAWSGSRMIACSNNRWR